MKKLVAAAALAAIIPAIAVAQDYPQDTVTIVVPFSPGGSNDTLGRFVANGLAQSLPGTVIVENMPGGGTAIGSAHVARAEPDGNTLLFVSSSYTSNAAVTAAEGGDLGFDAANDLVPVAMVATGEIGVLVGQRLPIASVEELLAAAASQEVFFATSGQGSIQHFGGEILNGAMDIDMVPVAYPGGTEGFLDLIAQRVDVIVGNVSTMFASSDGKAAVIATLGTERSKVFPDVPTMTELGYPDAVAQTYYVLMAPKGTPDDIVAKLNEAVRAVVASPEGTELLTQLELEPSDLTAEEVAQFVSGEITNWTALAQNF